MNIVINGRKNLATIGNICTINSGCVHYFESIDDNECSYVCYIFEESVFADNDAVQKYIHPLFHSLNPKFSIMSPDSAYIAVLAKILEQILFISNEKKPAYELYIVGLFNIFIASLYTAHPTTFNANDEYNSKLDDSMRYMLSFIHENYSHHISSEELCEVGQVSRSQCFSLFQKYTGDTPSRFILKYRLAIVRNMLSNTDIPIAQIATDCGFTHQSHLTSHFTKHYGITPLSYRKKKSAKTDSMADIMEEK